MDFPTWTFPLSKWLLSDCQFRVEPQERQAIAREADGQRLRRKIGRNLSFYHCCPLGPSSPHKKRGFVSEGVAEKRRERIWMTCECIYSTTAAAVCSQNLLHNLPAYLKAPMKYCLPFICCCLSPLPPIFCLIGIHMQSVCLANLRVFRPSRQSYPCRWMCLLLSFVISALPWWFTPLLQQFCVTFFFFNKLKAFTAPWHVRQMITIGTIRRGLRVALLLSSPCLTWRIQIITTLLQEKI